MMVLLSAAALALSPASAGGIGDPHDPLAVYLNQTLHTSNYRVARADLDNDGVAETVVYLTDDRYCGSGGCDLIILKPSPTGYRQVMKATIARPPIRQLSTRSHGWSDIGVLVSGGGVPRPYEARLRFDGRAYLSNPTLLPAGPGAGAEGRTLIGSMEAP